MNEEMYYNIPQVIYLFFFHAGLISAHSLPFYDDVYIRTYIKFRMFKNEILTTTEIPKLVGYLKDEQNTSL